MANVPSEYLYLANTNSMKLQGNGDLMFPKVSHDWINLNNNVTGSVPFGNTSWCGAWLYNAHSSEQNEVAIIDVMVGAGIITINVTGDDSGETGATVTYSTNIPDRAVRYSMSYRNGTPSIGYRPTTNIGTYKETSFPRLREALEYIYTHWTGINLYVNGEHWLNYDVNGFVIDYNWQSVPSISGKNGILSLVTLDSESINDGEPVSGAAVSVFDQNPVSGNNVKDIVDGNTPLIPSAVDVTATFIISNPPVGELASRILAAKKGSIPESIEDADKTVSIPTNTSEAVITGLDENSQYYFAIFVADATGDTAVSDPKDIYTSADEGWSFDYTGEIVEWTAPKTGIYQLETWGAQGGDATDGTLTARGGYGAYAYGEVLLSAGEKLYINVGGQDGYGGGGNGEIQYDIDDLLISTDVTNYVSGGSGNMSSIKSLAEQYEGTNKVIYTYTKYSGSGDYSSPTMSYIDKKFNYSRGGGVVAGYTGFPIRGMSGMKSIEFDIVTTDTEDGSFVIALIDGNSHNVNLYSEEPNTTSGGLKHVVVSSGLSDYTYTYFVIGISRTLTISNVKVTYAT